MNPRGRDSSADDEGQQTLPRFGPFDAGTSAAFVTEPEPGSVATPDGASSDSGPPASPPAGETLRHTSPDGTTGPVPTLAGETVPIPSAAESIGLAPSPAPRDFGSADLELRSLEGTLHPGNVLFDRYLVERQLGQGGMGSVWLVKHLELDAHRALKLIVSAIARDPQIRARFKREARVMARLAHPNAVAVHNAKLAKDAAFIEMEFIPGRSLDQVLRPGVPMPLDWTARILEQLCDVLQTAHDQGIVHRDLKPSNLMLVAGRPAGRELLKVLDFGIAKILNPDEGQAEDVKTKTGAGVFTPLYASPEQAAGGPVDTRSDLYAVGLLLYECLTGFRPFSGRQVTFQHLFSPPPPFAERNPAVSVPPGIERLVLRCLAKKPEERPQSARELYEAFRDALRDSAPPALTPAPTPAASTGLLMPPGSVTPTAVQEAPIPPTSATRPVTEPAPATGPVGLTSTPPQTSDREGRKLRVAARIAVAAIALLALSILAAFVIPIPIPIPDPRSKPPPGYEVEQAAGLESDGQPRVLVHAPSGARLVRIAGGDFTMGDDFDHENLGPRDDQPPHPVRLTGYYLMETEVTNAMMMAYFKDRNIAPDRRPPRWRRQREFLEDKNGLDSGGYPAVGIPYDVAADFARWAGGRLPTEAEWEYAARSRGKPNLYVWGNAPKPSPAIANVNSLGNNIPDYFLPKRMTRDRTEQGIYDLMGNVREWCLDWWAPYPASSEPQVDPRGPEKPPGGTPARHIIRGGSFLTWADQVATTGPRLLLEHDRTADELGEDGSAEDLGFRIALPWPGAPRSH